jgi:hypothetical protein
VGCGHGGAAAGVSASMISYGRPPCTRADTPPSLLSTTAFGKCALERTQGHGPFWLRFTYVTPVLVTK